MNEETKQFIKVLKGKVEQHKKAYHTDFCPDYTLKENPKPSIAQVSFKMGRHMCDCFIIYINESCIEVVDQQEEAQESIDLAMSKMGWGASEEEPEQKIELSKSKAREAVNKANESNWVSGSNEYWNIIDKELGFKE